MYVRFALCYVYVCNVYALTTTCVSKDMQIVSFRQLEEDCDWQGVHQEQTKATATLRKLQRSLQDLENIKSKLDTSQQPDFEQLFRPIRENTRKAIEDFAGEFSSVVYFGARDYLSIW